MISAELENLARIGKLKRELPTDAETEGLLASAAERLADAQRADLAFSSRFDLADNAAHALPLATLRRAGYRSDNHYLVFQSLPHTFGMEAAQWRVLAKAHERRNLAEYEGRLDHDEQLLAEVIAIADALRDALAAPRGSPASRRHP